MANPTTTKPTNAEIVAAENALGLVLDEIRLSDEHRSRLLRAQMITHALAGRY